MSTIAQITDQADSRVGYWVCILRQREHEVRGVILDGQFDSNQDINGVIFNRDALGPTYNCSQYAIELPMHRFARFPVQNVYGPKTASNSAGEYVITGPQVNAVAAAGSLGGTVPAAKNQPSPASSSPASSPPPVNGVGKSAIVPVAPPPPAPVVLPQSGVQPVTTGLNRSGADGVPVVTVGDVVRFLGAVPAAQAIMIWGPAGVGKSQAVQEFSQEQGKTLYDVRLPLLDPVDLRGIGVPDLQNRKCVWLPPEFIPTQPNSVLFLDEITAAPPSLQALAYQLTLDRQIGETKLPPDCQVVCAGNRVTDRGVAYTMPSPLANRLFHLEVQADLGSWRQWAYARGIDPRIISFLTLRSEFLHKMDAATAGQAWPSPRSWAFTHRMLHSGLGASDLGVAVAACIGVAATKEFIIHCRDYVKYTAKVEEILNGKARDYKEVDPSRAQVLAVAVVANAVGTDHVLHNVLEWAENQNGEYEALVRAGLEQRFGDDRVGDVLAGLKVGDPLQRGRRVTVAFSGMSPMKATW